MEARVVRGVRTVQQRARLRREPVAIEGVGIGLVRCKEPDRAGAQFLAEVLHAEAGRGPDARHERHVKAHDVAPQIHPVLQVRGNEEHVGAGGFDVSSHRGHVGLGNDRVAELTCEGKPSRADLVHGAPRDRVAVDIVDVRNREAKCRWVSTELGRELIRDERDRGMTEHRASRRHAKDQVAGTAAGHVADRARFPEQHP